MMADDSIENRFSEVGISGVVHTKVTEASHDLYEVFAPADLGAGGTKSPIVTWGNGTGATVSKYYPLLNHLASWGIVVIASSTSKAGTGEEMVAGAWHLIAENTTAGSSFEGRLDTEHIASVGHSQGAGGSTRAALNHPDLITTAVPINLPGPRWIKALRGIRVTPADHLFDLTQLTRPVFLVGGSKDIISLPGANTVYYDKVPGPAAVGCFTGVDHLAVSKKTVYFGYVTAWLRYQLFDDPAARPAFVGDQAELLINEAWQNQGVKNLA